MITYNSKKEIKYSTKACNTRSEKDIKRALVLFFTEGLGLVGVPAKNIYNIFMGVWYQVDKEVSLKIQSLVKGYEASYIKS